MIIRFPMLILAGGHPLFSVPDAEIGGDVLKDYECINHRYAIHRDKLNFARYDSFSASATRSKRWHC